MYIRQCLLKHLAKQEHEMLHTLLERVSGRKIKEGHHTVQNKACLNSFIKLSFRFWSL